MFFLGCDLWIPQKAMQNHSGGVCSLFPPLSHPHTVAPDGTESPIIPPSLSSWMGPGWTADGRDSVSCQAKGPGCGGKEKDEGAKLKQ